MSQSNLAFEDLSNDIIMEIFDYLYGQHIIFTFFHLNSRFNSICNHYSHYHIDASDYQTFTNKRKFKHLLHVIYTKHIRSLTFCAEQYIRRISMKYLLSLHSLTFKSIHNPTKIVQFLRKLSSPHHLHHISIHMGYCQHDTQELLTTIVKLPNLKRLEWISYVTRQGLIPINQRSLSLRHLSMSYEGDEFLQLIPCIPNLISLHLSGNYRTYNLLSTQTNKLSKVKYLHMTDVSHLDCVSSILELCPFVKCFKAQTHPLARLDTVSNAKNWEEVLSPMKFLEQIEILMKYDKDSVDLLDYQTSFWIERNFRVLVYLNQETNSTIFCIKNMYC